MATGHEEVELIYVINGNYRFVGFFLQQSVDLLQISLLILLYQPLALNPNPNLAQFLPERARF